MTIFSKKLFLKSQIQCMISNIIYSNKNFLFAKIIIFVKLRNDKKVYEIRFEDVA